MKLIVPSSPSGEDGTELPTTKVAYVLGVVHVTAPFDFTSKEVMVSVGAGTKRSTLLRVVVGMQGFVTKVFTPQGTSRNKLLLRGTKP
jgi:hypothetical protein